MTPSDHDLLRQFFSERSDDAFRELVKRHANLVYSAAYRQLGSMELAKDVSQEVFTLLIKKGRSISQSVVVSGWLFRAATFIAKRLAREETRRRGREELAMNSIDHTPTEDPPWERVAPLLNEAILQLKTESRNVLLLRYFEQKSFEQTASQFGITEGAAKMRVARAIEPVILVSPKQLAASDSGVTKATGCG